MVSERYTIVHSGRLLQQLGAATGSATGASASLLLATRLAPVRRREPSDLGLYRTGSSQSPASKSGNLRGADAASARPTFKSFCRRNDKAAGQALDSIPPDATPELESRIRCSNRLQLILGVVAIREISGPDPRPPL
jgi:hypothetical protein